MTMKKPLSIRDYVVTLNGHLVGGWSQDSDAFMPPTDHELVTVERGADGQMAVYASGEEGIPLSIKLLPTSESARFFLQQAQIQRRDGIILWNGSVVNTGQNYSYELKNGVMTRAPVLGTPVGKGAQANYVFVWEFESIVDHLETAKFNPFAP